METVINSRFLTQNLTGVQRYATEISLLLKDMNTNVQYISSKDILQKAYAKALGVNLQGASTGHIWEQLELPLYLSRNKNPLLINLANTAPVLYKNKIITIHDLSYLRNPAWYSKKFYYTYKYMIPEIAKNSLKIVTVSEFSKKEIIDLLKIPEEKIEVVYNAVADEFVALASQKVDNNIYGEYILAVSSLDPRKNFKNLILAFNRLKLKDIKLVIVGAENKIFSNNELKELIESNENIIFTGYVSDEHLAGLYINAKLFVYPSLYEGFGIPPLEAMSCNCPVIASDTSSLPEVCADAAYYISPHSVENITKGIFEVINDEKIQNELKEKGQNRIKMFDWKKSAKSYQKIISKFI